MRAENLLSDEEMEAILATASAGALSAEDRGRRAASGGSTASLSLSTPLARALREAGEKHGSQLATSYQRPMNFELFDLRSVPAELFAESMLAEDRPVVIRCGSEGESGAILLGRSLLYGWMTIAFGGQVEVGVPPIPERNSSRIELRFLLGAAREVLGQLEKSLGELHPLAAAIDGPVEPGGLVEVLAPRLLVASYEASGFGALARLRIALPESALGQGARGPVAHEPFTETGALLPRLATMAMRVGAEIGSAELTVGELRALRVGDLLPLSAPGGGGVAVLLEGKPRFRGERGLIGNRLAVRIAERL